ncbi:MAG: Gfo/Idh/MocA family oxidoreductase [Desulfobacterales bacterium]|nr:Gfo/Idh/MocA family oxidoreductase [Desulfobacterales bacterium]
MKFLICGVGSVGERHIRNLLSLEHDNIILYRTRFLPLRTTEQSFLSFSSLDDALSERPNAAFITNPTNLHIPVALRCAKLGCHLFIEKPLSHNLDGIDELQKIVIAKKLIVCIGFQFRFHPGLKKIKELLDEQAIGRVVHVAAHWGEYLPDWHPWEDYRKGYSAREDLGGGVILTLCHPFDYLRWLIGEISYVASLGGSLGDLTLPVEDTVDVLLQFNSGLIGHVHLDYIQRPPSHWLQITGCNGVIKWDNSDGNVHLYRTNNSSWETFSVLKEFERNNMFIDEIQHFIDCIQGSKGTSITLDDGIKSLKVVMAIKQSIREQRTINV